MSLINRIVAKQILTPWDYIVLGFFFHALGRIVNLATGSEILQAAVASIGWIYIIKGFLRIRKQLQLRGFVSFLFNAYILICVIMIIRGYIIDYPYQWFTFQGMINYHFFQPYYILPYLMPLIAFIPLKHFHFGSIVRFSVLFVCLLHIFAVVFLPQITKQASLSLMGYDTEGGIATSVTQIYIPFAFVTLCQKYVSRKVVLVNILALALCLVIVAIAGRRGMTLNLSCLLFFNLYFCFKAVKGARKLLVVLLGTVAISLSAYMAFNSSSFSYIRQRGFEDNRSGVDMALMSQMTATEKVIGKGLNGRYYYPLSSLENDYLNGWRYGSETGFYNIVLKGGYLMAFVYIFLLGIPALRGMFKSRNMFCKAGGFYVFLSLLELYPFGWLSFNIKFLIIWMLVVMLNSNVVRKMTDSQIKAYFFDNNQAKRLQ